jgi:hypothetical protein
MPKVGNNSQCPCGSNKKYKRCCLLKKPLIITCDVCEIGSVKDEKCEICDDMIQLSLLETLNANHMSPSKLDKIRSPYAIKYKDGFHRLLTTIKPRVMKKHQLAKYEDADIPKYDGIYNKGTNVLCKFCNKILPNSKIIFTFSGEYSCSKCLNSL